MSDVRTQQARELPDVKTCERMIEGAEEVLANPDAYDPSEVMSARRQQVVWRTYRSYADRVAVLETALRTHGYHQPPCPLWITSGTELPCSCGYDAALAGAAAEPD